MLLRNRLNAYQRAAGAIFLMVSATLIADKAVAEPFEVAVVEIDDMKPVFATVRSTDQAIARARISGTVLQLTVDEGDQVRQGQRIGVVVDPKLNLQIRSLDAKIRAAEERFKNAGRELERGRKLIKRKTISQAKLDNLETANSIAESEYNSVLAERLVVNKQRDEGEVLAPASGRVLKVPVTRGSVVLAGEALATIAANRYVLRLEVPERHARILKKGHTIIVGARGPGGLEKPTGTGTIVQIYPELQQGRVAADAEVSGLGDYFVGERAIVWISAGKRKTLVVPRDYVFKRYGLDYVKLAGEGGRAIEIVVQTGQNAQIRQSGDAIEVLAGLRAGDRLVRP